MISHESSSDDRFYYQQLVSEPGFDLEGKDSNYKSIFQIIKMAKKSLNGERGASTPSLKLTKTNYQVWSMTMEVYLDSHDLWHTIIGENATKKKDHQALSAIISGVPKDLLDIIDLKKTVKDNWEIVHGQSDLVPHSRASMRFRDTHHG